MGNEEGISWETTDVLSADTTDVLSADTTDVLFAATTEGLSTPCSVGGPEWRSSQEFASFGFGVVILLRICKFWGPEW